MSSLEKLWYQTTENQNISPEIAKRWLNLVQTKYNSESHRVYHNLDVLDKKCAFLISIEASLQYSDNLIFAIVFQYFHFDLKTDCSEQNCTSFREFVTEAGIDNVSPFLSNLMTVDKMSKKKTIFSTVYR